jgi:hypothetical protein
MCGEQRGLLDWQDLYHDYFEWNASCKNPGYRLSINRIRTDQKVSAVNPMTAEWRLTAKPADVAQTPPLWPIMAAFVTFAVPIKFVSTYAASGADHEWQLHVM